MRQFRRILIAQGLATYAAMWPVVVLYAWAGNAPLSAVHFRWTWVWAPVLLPPLLCYIPYITGVKGIGPTLLAWAVYLLLFLIFYVLQTVPRRSRHG